MNNVRRSFRWQAGGLGGVALSWLLHRDGFADAPGADASGSPPAKAKRVILIFCPGGMSHIDTFDYKSELVKQDGKPLGKKIDTFFGQPGNLMTSTIAFKQH